LETQEKNSCAFPFRPKRIFHLPKALAQNCSLSLLCSNFSFNLRKIRGCSGLSALDESEAASSSHLDHLGNRAAWEISYQENVVRNGDRAKKSSYAMMFF